MKSDAYKIGLLRWSKEVKWFVYDYYLLLIFAAFVAVAFHIRSLILEDGKWAISLTVIGTLITFISFIYKQRLDDAKFFNDLFQRFNERYDKLNGRLNMIPKNRGAPALTDCEKNTVYDYFNLCAEEYLFYIQGYIHPDAWKSWVNGMRSFYARDRIKNLWLEERVPLVNSSYYGFDLAEVVKVLGQ